MLYRRVGAEKFSKLLDEAEAGHLIRICMYLISEVFKDVEVCVRGRRVPARGRR